jgi:hypothetical protein
MHPKSAADSKLLAQQMPLYLILSKVNAIIGPSSNLDF